MCNRCFYNLVNFFSTEPCPNGWGSFFNFIGNFVPYKIKPSGGDAHKREKKYVAKATALGARVSQAKLFIL